MNEESHISNSITPPNPAISVITTVYNEVHTIDPLVQRLHGALEGRDYELILVDDGSSDGSLEKIRGLSANDSRVRYVSLTRNFGKTSALSAGFLAVRGDIVVTIDADLQDIPEEIPQLIKQLDEANLDLVVGWKYPRRDSLFKRIVSRIFNLMVRFSGGPPLHDSNCGLKAMRAGVVKSMKMYGELHRFIPLLALRKGFRVGEMRVSHEPRAHGRSKFGLERYIRALFDLISLAFLTRYSRRPLHLIGGLGVILILAGLGVLGYLSWGWIHGEYIQGRPMFFIGILFLIMGGQTLTIGLVMEMVTFYNHVPGEDFAIREIGGRGLGTGEKVQD